MDDIYFKKIMTAIVLVALLVLTFFLIKPILLSMIFGLILAFILTPVYNKFLLLIKSKNISATLICVLLLTLVILPFWFLTPTMIDQSIKVYINMQQMDFITPIQKLFPSISQQFSIEVASIVQSFLTKMTNSLMNSLSLLILNFPFIFLHLTVVFFTFFFALRDKELFVNYLQSLSPFSKETEKKLFQSSKNITSSVIYGQIIVGIIQGIIVGIGFFIFRVPNALLLTLLASLAGVFPIIGTAMIWVPVVIYFFIAGNTFLAIGITIFGLVSSSIDNFLRPIIVSKRTHMHSALVLIGMIGGLFLFGVLGLILGPLVIAYLLIVLEIYRNKKVSGIFIQEPI